VRHFIFALMIALLPLRGWVGDAMAMQMAVHTLQQAGQASSSGHQSQEAIATETIAARAGNTLATGSLDHHATAVQVPAPHDCLEHTGAGSDDGISTDLASADAGSGCPDCAFCQACHTVALTSAAPNLSPTAHPGSLPQPAAAQFASAEAAPGQKPPIS
jgi:hypothetical protein